MLCNVYKTHCTLIKLFILILCGSIIWIVLFRESSFQIIQSVIKQPINSIIGQKTLSSLPIKISNTTKTLPIKISNTSKIKQTNPQKSTPRPIKRNSSSEICPEKYRGLYKADYPYRYQTWTRENCSVEMDIGDFVTVLVNFRGIQQDEVKLKRLAQSLREAYPSVKMLIGLEKNTTINIEGIEIIYTEGKNAWHKLLNFCKTKYVLFGFDLDYISIWMNLHRGIRLLGEGAVAVTGATRNSTGHWTIPCYQVGLRYYRLELQEGYSTAVDDCMVCDYAGGPVLVAKENIKNIKTDLPESIMMLDWSLRTKGQWLTCPDIMYHTEKSDGKDAEGVSREVWRILAKTWGIQGVVTQWRPRMKEVFNCTEVGLSCDSAGQAASFRLQTWCCHQSFHHVLSSLERLAVEQGLDYEIGDGTLLGAVKMGNYMPWDIDADLDYNKKQLNSYQAGGNFEVWLKKEGIKIDPHQVNGGAWYFHLLYQGIKVELWPNKYENLSRTFTPDHLRHSPTRIQVGNNLWLRTYANPGLGVRGRYGPKLLHHSESWYLHGMGNGGDLYHPGDWKKCKVPGHHACLSNYPTVGNMGLLPNNYP